ncbi:hypothetical protein Z517_00426 [Fonsecaea pedrosoi CBS 271.37]|uniref:Uncharacterized protein n=1 Tax=Fonsecaea pedrosoi CBS 271.37 TaxID=1442368 RepID=A0A0D2GVT1_9EURO|nr:uncharacterized protein Z517_00426 [Fonsecaea pedrosoi CBS 271.37]KIW85038.1 hypothetical protein Z517_00426 [Fonsecaea pedrosoi CBS 271.37]
MNDAYSWLDLSPDVGDGLTQEEPSTIFGTGEQKKDDILVGSNTTPLATFVVHRSLPSQENALSPWRRFAKWCRTHMCRYHHPEDIKPGVIKMEVSETTRVDIVEMPFGCRGQGRGRGRAGRAMHNNAHHQAAQYDTWHG